MKKIANFLCLVMVMAFVFMTDASAAYRIPESQTYNGYLPDGTSVYDTMPDLQYNNGIAPHTLLGYEYVPGYERNLEMPSESQKYDIRFAYIYGTTVTFDAGSAPQYTLTVTRSTTEGIDFLVDGEVEGAVDISAVKSKLAASLGYKTTNTATVYRGETYSCNLTQPGRYDLSWYMRGHRYIAQCGAKVISTDSDHGRFTYCTLGTITYPTNEVAFDVSRIY